jgi:hypothetical protein
MKYKRTIFGEQAEALISKISVAKKLPRDQHRTRSGAELPLSGLAT